MSLFSLFLQETLFDPVSLGCGHLFCYMCACKASSVSVVDGLKAASGRKKCPVCREVTCNLIYRRCPRLVFWLCLFGLLLVQWQILAYKECLSLHSISGGNIRICCEFGRIAYPIEKKVNTYINCLCVGISLMPLNLGVIWTVGLSTGKNAAKWRKQRELRRQSSIGSLRQLDLWVFDVESIHNASLVFQSLPHFAVATSTFFISAPTPARLQCNPPFYPSLPL